MKKLILIFMLCCSSQVFYAADRKMETDLAASIELAQKNKKLIFITYGRESCGNCQNLKKLINQKKVKLFESEFVLVDLNCDDKAVSKEFYKLYRDALKDAKTLPFVVVARADGSLVDSISSYQDAEKYNKFIMSAKSKAKKP